MSPTTETEFNVNTVRKLMPELPEAMKYTWSQIRERIEAAAKKGEVEVLFWSQDILIANAENFDGKIIHPDQIEALRMESFAIQQSAGEHLVRVHWGMDARF